MIRAFQSTSKVILRQPKMAASLSTSAGQNFSNVELNLQKLNLSLPEPKPSVANYVMYNRVGNLVYTSGHLPFRPDNTLVTGKIGKELTTEEGVEAAKLVGLGLISTMKAAVGDLDSISRIVKVTGFVNCVDSFQSQPVVVNGFSDLMIAAFGEAGRHARSAVGVNALPLNVPVEIEIIFEVKDSA